MRARAKSSETPYPIWVEGEYITNPPKRPSDGAERPAGHYIDKGGYPGANVYAVNMETYCCGTGVTDRKNTEIFECDLLLYETEEEIGYFIVQDTETVIDVINGEILELKSLQKADIKIIGNLIDTPDFVDGMRYYVENDIEIPYLPALNVQLSVLPYLKLRCTKCGNEVLSCAYMARHKNCGGYFTAGFATKIYRKREKALA